MGQHQKCFGNDRCVTYFILWNYKYQDIQIVNSFWVTPYIDKGIFQNQDMHSYIDKVSTN